MSTIAQLNLLRALLWDIDKVATGEEQVAENDTEALAVIHQMIKRRML